MLVDHAFTIPLKLFWPAKPVSDPGGAGLHQHRADFPLPSARRCYAFGQAVV